MLEGRGYVNQGSNSDMGIKNGQKNPDVFNGRPLSMTSLLEHNVAQPTEHIF